MYVIDSANEVWGRHEINGEVGTEGSWKEVQHGSGAGGGDP